MEPLSGNANWIVFDNRRRWKHYQRSGGDGVVTEVAGGVNAALKTDRGDINEIVVVSASGVFEVFLNGTPVTIFEVGEADLPAYVSAIAGFTSEDQPVGAPTQLVNYAAWSLGR